MLARMTRRKKAASIWALYSLFLFFVYAIMLWAFGIIFESPFASWVSTPFNWYWNFWRFLLCRRRDIHACDIWMTVVGNLNFRAVIELSVLSIEDIPQIVFSTIVDRQDGGDITGYALANIVTSIYGLVARGAAGVGSIARSGAMVDQLPAGMLVLRLEGNTDREVLNTIDEARRARAAASKCDKEAREKERNLQRRGHGAEEQDVPPFPPVPTDQDRGALLHRSYTHTPN